MISGFCTPAIASGIFWSKSTSGTTWNSEDGYGNDPCVYAYTQPATEAEINVKANDEIISDGSSFDFLTHDIGTNTDITFTIENLGGSNLILTGSPIITISGADAGQFSVQQSRQVRLHPMEIQHLLYDIHLLRLAQKLQTFQLPVMMLMKILMILLYMAHVNVFQ